MIDGVSSISMHTNNEKESIICNVYHKWESPMFENMTNLVWREKRRIISLEKYHANISCPYIASTTFVSTLTAVNLKCKTLLYQECINFYNLISS